MIFSNVPYLITIVSALQGIRVCKRPRPEGKERDGEGNILI